MGRYWVAINYVQSFSIKALFCKLWKQERISSLDESDFFLLFEMATVKNRWNIFLMSERSSQRGTKLQQFKKNSQNIQASMMLSGLATSTLVNIWLFSFARYKALQWMLYVCCGFLIVIVLWGFQFFSPFTYGQVALSATEINQRKWLKTWDMLSHPNTWHTFHGYSH